jgi:hypothetical protein
MSEHGGLHRHITMEEVAQAQCRSCLLRPVMDATSARSSAEAVECTNGEHCELRKMRRRR